MAHHRPKSALIPIDIFLFRLIASGRVIEFGSSTRSELGRVDSKSWNRKVDSISRIEIDYSIRFLRLKSKPDPKNRPKSLRLLIK